MQKIFFFGQRTVKQKTHLFKYVYLFIYNFFKILMYLKLIKIGAC